MKKNSFVFISFFALQVRF